jgi:hypothetical protein
MGMGRLFEFMFSGEVFSFWESSEKQAMKIRK